MRGEAVETTQADASLNHLAAAATLNCLVGCATGEVTGMVIGTALGHSDFAPIVLVSDSRSRSATA